MVLPQHKIILDPSGKNAPEQGFLLVPSEVDFLERDGKGDLWVSGYACDFVRRVYDARNIDITEIESPENALRAIIGPLVDRLSPLTIKKSLTVLDRQDVRCLADILAGLTGDELWTQEPSYDHAARFLVSDTPDELSDLVEKQVEVWAKATVDPQLAEVYSSGLKDRESMLREWLVSSEARTTLSEFPLKLTGKYAELLRTELGRQLRSSKGAAISSFPKKTPNKPIYGKAIVDYFSHNGETLSADVLSIASGLLSLNERNLLERLLPLSEIEPLPHSATIEQALAWAIDRYLPQRSSQVEDGRSFDADRMAASFADWLLRRYPELTHVERQESPLNIRTFYKIQQLAKTHSVLWVVVDGLSYTNHQRLVALIGSKSMSLRASENVPLISILPTITERAKYGLTTGRFPDENINLNWNTKNNFLSAFPDGVYAGNTGMSNLAEGLRRETPTVCYWNYTKIDKCHHEQIDSDYLRHEIDAHLESLANHINRIVSTAQRPEKVAVVISTDHGQLTAPCRRVEFPSGECQILGRTVLHPTTLPVDMANAFLKDSVEETVLLNPKSFRLGEPTTLALGSTFFVSIAAESEGAIGVHGGLYPEEVVVGMAVLTCNPEYLPISAVVTGEGETGNQASVRLVIDNPNHVPINPLSVSINSLVIDQQGELLLAKVRAQSTFEIDITIENFPQPNSGDQFVAEGSLTYEFDDGRQETCSLTGHLKCNTLYKPKNPSLLDRFKE